MAMTYWNKHGWNSSSGGGGAGGSHLSLAHVQTDRPLESQTDSQKCNSLFIDESVMFSQLSREKLD